MSSCRQLILPRDISAILGLAISLNPSELRCFHTAPGQRPIERRRSFADGKAVTHTIAAGLPQWLMSRRCHGRLGWRGQRF